MSSVRVPLNNTIPVYACSLSHLYAWPPTRFEHKLVPTRPVPLRAAHLVRLRAPVCVCARGTINPRSHVHILMDRQVLRPMRALARPRTLSIFNAKHSHGTYACAHVRQRQFIIREKNCAAACPGSRKHVRRSSARNGESLLYLLRACALSFRACVVVRGGFWLVSGLRTSTRLL